ncbi:MAG: hypothetical protein C5B60_07555 [Chloroflexi bacterium]|nr:MAG: hypothetical protein C5B60_07555 [Chloroflexota bacterium]
MFDTDCSPILDRSNHVSPCGSFFLPVGGIACSLSQGEIRGSLVVVFVTVGSAPQGFERLLKEVDRLAGNGMFGDEQVLVQVGHSKYIPVHCKSESFVSREEFRRILKEASLVICHGGSTPLEVIRAGKVPIVMPRRKRFGEIVNDHQVEFVQALAEKGLIIPTMNAEELSGAISRAKQYENQVQIPVSPMVGMVARSLEELCS